MVDPTVAFIVPLVVTLIVSLAATLGAYLQSRATRVSEDWKWLRERRAQAYVDLVKYYYADDMTRSQVKSEMYGRMGVFASATVDRAWNAWLNAPDELASERWDQLQQLIRADIEVERHSA